MGWLGGGGSPAYVPTDFANLKYWHDISQLTGYSNGEEVLTIPDLSGNGMDLTTTPGLGGIYTENFHGSIPGLLMDGTKIYVPAGGKPAWDWKHQGSSTTFWIVQSSVDNTSHILFDSGPGASSSFVGRLTTFRTTSPGSNPGSFGDTARASGGTQIFSNIFPDENTIPKDELHLIMCRYEVGVGQEIYVDNVLKRSVAQSNAPTITTSTSNPRFYGRSGPLNCFNGITLGDFGYDRALTDDEVNKVVGGFNYGLL